MRREKRDSRRDRTPAWKQASYARLKAGVLARSRIPDFHVLTGNVGGEYVAITAPSHCCNRSRKIKFAQGELTGVAVAVETGAIPALDDLAGTRRDFAVPSRDRRRSSRVPPVRLASRRGRPRARRCGCADLVLPAGRHKPRRKQETRQLNKQSRPPGPPPRGGAVPTSRPSPRTGQVGRGPFHHAGIGAGRRPGPRPWRTAGWGPCGDTSGRSFPGREAGPARGGLARVARTDLLKCLENAVAQKRRPAGEAVRRGWRPARRRRRPGRSLAAGRRLLGGHVRAACRGRSPRARSASGPVRLCPPQARGQAEVGDLGTEVGSGAAKIRHRPFRVTLTRDHSIRLSRMFAGLRSRWTMPCSWAWCMARASVSTRRPPSRAGQWRPVERVLRGCRRRRTPGEVRLAVVLADLVDLHDVGVLQAGRRPRPRCGSVRSSRGAGVRRRPGSS